MDFIVGVPLAHPVSHFKCIFRTHTVVTLQQTALNMQ